MNLIHLIAGQICSGKTTYSKYLEDKTGAVRLSPDEWMLRLYQFDIKDEEFDSYFFICCELAWEVAKKFISKDIDVILDFGFWTKSFRDEYINKSAEIGAMPQLYYIHCNEDKIRERLKERNKIQNNGCFIITENSFDFFSKGFEKPGDDEVFTFIDNS